MISLIFHVPNKKKTKLPLAEIPFNMLQLQSISTVVHTLI